VTADSSRKRPRVERAMSIASVVLPVPGGPHSTTDSGRVALDEPAQRRAAGQQVALADDLVEGARAHPHREGGHPLGRLLLGGVEQRVPGHAATLRRPRRSTGVRRTACAR
jgi:hypothetical protein